MRLLSALPLLLPPPSVATDGGVPPILFEEASARWNVTFRHQPARTGEFYMIENMGSGVAILDYDRDGDQDLFFVDGAELPGYEGEPPRSTLLRNDGGRFVDVTRSAGLDLEAYGMGVSAADVDGDGNVDLYVTAFGTNRLLRNDGDGTFTNVTDRSGAGDPAWGASAAFADVDADGDLDLYVTNYVDFSFDNNVVCGLEEKGLRSYCNPDVYDGLPDRFYRNRGDGSFVDATEEAGFAGASGKGLGVVFGDVDLDGWIDLYVANDMTANFLFHNRGDGTFEEIALLAGAAYSHEGKPEAGMGVDLGDVDGDGRADLVVTHFDYQTTALYGNLGSGLFSDRRFTSGLAEPSVYLVGFGVALADFDQDGDLDAAVANGHTIHNVEQWGRGSAHHYRQPNQIFLNEGGGRFRELVGAGVDVVRASRGLATGDLDGDGDLDLVITNSNDLAEVYENRSRSGGWLLADLRDREGNVQAIGARLEMTSGGTTQHREVRTASSYMSQNATTVHFGLAGAERIAELGIRWPAGGTTVLRDLPVSHRLLVVRRGAP